MKRIVSILFAVVCVVNLSAQTDDSVGRNVISFGGADSSSYGEYLIDLDLFAISQPTLPKVDFSVENILNNYYKRLNLNTDVVYGQKVSAPYYSTFTPMGFSSSDNLQAATFRLKSGGMLTTYGNYKADGTRAPYTGVPWGKNDFQGGFRLKSANGNFSFGMEVRYEKNNGMWR